MFSSMFGMMGNYEARCVGRLDGDNGLMVSTAAVTDSDYPFETAVAHEAYNDGEMLIVENYSSREDAEAGHERWVKTMTAPELPAELKDVGAAFIAQLCDAVGSDFRKPAIHKDIA